jgi:taurine dioxygenase
MTHSLVGLPEQESDAMLAQICDHIECEEFVYEHAWAKGDLLMWDNRSSIHARKDFPAEQTRLMWRTTLAGDIRPM